jgi:hypothetical protein
MASNQRGPQKSGQKRGSTNRREVGFREFFPNCSQKSSQSNTRYFVHKQPDFQPGWSFRGWFWLTTIPEIATETVAAAPMSVMAIYQQSTARFYFRVADDPSSDGKW